MEVKNSKEKLSYQIITEAERIYTYAQSHQIQMQTGLIGYLRADFGSDGLNFYSTWYDIIKDLKTEEFKREFDDVINYYRLEKHFLSSRGALASFCNSQPESSYENDRNHYGIRIDTEKYSYLMRLTPVRGDYNLYCYCYQKEYLTRHLQKAQKGIRFIDSHYNEQFRIPDGGQIKITRSDGSISVRVCRYIDDYHVYIGSQVFHICEFAELTQKNGDKVSPLC